MTQIIRHSQCATSTIESGANDFGWYTQASRGRTATLLYTIT